MNEDVFNIEIRKFLKRFGVTAQREIERAVGEALERGALKGTETLPVRATLSIPGVLDEHEITGELDLSARGEAGGGDASVDPSRVR
jgi:hypothetical protein